MTEIVALISDRFWAKVDAHAPCWNWTASVDGRGYGQFAVRHGVNRRAHRIAWEILVGPIEPKLVLDHLCRNKICVNPDHLEPVTDAENIRRGRAGYHQGNVREMCRRNLHPMSEAQYRSNGTRYCKACSRGEY